MKNPDRKLLVLLDKYLPAEGEMSSGGTVLNTVYRNLQNPEMLIPVLGLQGVGKSTLINGILAEDIMPNDADETTCIPVEVRQGASSQATVYFQDGRTEHIGQKELAQYVDNNYNRGNEKQVSHIILERNSELLSNGIVLVDLPGVGSLTKANAETTKEYIKRLNAAIFVIRVNPPITRTEANFIRIAWNSLSDAWFVQNRWNNESDREAKEGLEANKSILKDIAEKTKTPYSGEILTVNAYKALLGVLRNDSQSIETSNIGELRSKLSEISRTWKTETEKQGLTKIKSLFSLVKDEITDAITTYKLSKKELEKKLQEEQEKFQKTTVKIEKEISGIEDLLDEQKRKATPFINNLVQKAEENIRVNVYRVIDGGVTDGEDLTQAFNDYQMQEFAIVNDEFETFVSDRLLELGEKMSTLNDLLETEAKQNFTSSSFSKRQEFKWEKGMDAVAKISSGVGGIFAGVAIGTAIGGPIGTVVGLLAGIAISILGGVIGGGGKKLVIEQRASETKRQIAPYIDEVSDNIKRELKKGFAAMCDGIAEKLRCLSTDRKNDAKKDREEKISILKNENNAEEKLAELNADMEYLIKEETSYVH